MMPIRLTPAVKAIMIACFAAFLVQKTGDSFFHTSIGYYFALTPDLAVNHHYLWQLFTYAFLHADPMHLFFNLLMLAFIGSELEMIWGRAKFLRFYFFCSVMAGITYLVIAMLTDQTASPMVGASGGIYGLLMAYGLIFSERVLLFMMLFPMKAKQFVWVLAGIEFMSTVFSAHNAWGSVAHLGGMAAGFGLLWGKAAWKVYQRRRVEFVESRRRNQRRKASNHLRLVVNKTPQPPSKGKGKGSSGDQDSDGTPTTWH
jgi:membrane associated rhomboid family serine protease